MKKHHALFILLLLITGLKASAQDFPVPQGYSLKAKEDYAQYEPNIIASADWLQKTPWTDDPNRRKEVTTFLIAWLTGSPTVNIEINGEVAKLIDKNIDLIAIYMGNYAKYALQHKDNFDKNQANATALRAMIDKYNNEPTHVKNDEMEHIIQLNKDGKLDDWIKTDFYKS